MSRKEKAKAQHWLDCAKERQHSSSVVGLIELMRDTKVRLEEIGTSEEEVQKLLKNGYKSDAKKKFTRDLNKEPFVNTYISEIRSLAANAGVTLEAIGASEGILARIEKNCKIAKAVHWLEKAEENQMAEEGKTL